MQNEVQKQTVEYNSAVSGMADQLVLLNIARAKAGMPTFYTSISRLSGSISVQAAAGFNAQLKGAQPTTTSSTTDQAMQGTGTSTSNMTSTGSQLSTAVANGTSLTQSASTGSAGNTISTTSSNMTTTTPETTSASSITQGGTASASNTMTNLVQTAVARGGNIYTPSVSGQITSGPSFDIEILDTQQFYQGMLSSIDAVTFMNFLDQGIDNDLLYRLFVYQVRFRAAKDKIVTIKDEKTSQENKVQFSKGQIVATWTNPPLTIDREKDAEKFWEVAKCYALTTSEEPGDDQPIALVSKILTSGDGKESPLKLSDLATLDGKQLGLKIAVKNVNDETNKQEKNVESNASMSDVYVDERCIYRVECESR